MKTSPSYDLEDQQTY